MLLKHKTLSIIKAAGDISPEHGCYIVECVLSFNYFYCQDLIYNVTYVAVLFANFNTLSIYLVILARSNLIITPGRANFGSLKKEKNLLAVFFY